MYIKGTLTMYLDDLAAKKPAPGGGSAAALSAALGAALIAMVANYTVGKEKYRDVEEDVRSILQDVEQVRESCAKLVDEDVASYLKFKEAYATKDPAKIELASKEAASVPFEVCKQSGDGMILAERIVDKGNKNLISDVGVAAELFMAAYESAKMNIDINLKNITDAAFAGSVRSVIDPLDAIMRTKRDQIVENVRRALQ